MKYTPKYFRDNMPEWKRRKDPTTCRFFYRPLSFYCSSFCANHSINANTVSYFSGWLALAACVCFIPNVHWLHIIGAVLFNVWLLLDCTDGNLARSYKRQPFGDFSDAISSYMLVGFMGVAMGVACYFDGGVIFESGSPWIILLGALFGSCDTMMRLIYQKYRDNERAMVDKGIMPAEVDVFKDHGKVGDWKVRLNMELGIAGILPITILLAAIFNFLDIVILYCLCYYGGSFIISYVIYVKKAIKKARMYQDKMTEI